MKYQVTLETAIIVSKYGVSPICCWPLPVGSSRWVIIKQNIKYWIVTLNLLLTFGGSCNTIYEYRDDLSKMVKVASEMTAVTSTMMKMLICKLQAPRIQVLITNMETFLKQATEKDKEVIQGYVDKCLLVYVVTLVSAVIGPLAFIAGPLATAQPFPGDIIYPFSTEQTWVWAAMYLSQSICTVQVGCMVVVDVLFAILLWYAGIRFHILYLALREATNPDEVNRCIQQHQEVFEYVDELTITARIIAVEVTAAALFTVTTGGFILMGDLTAVEWAKYIFFELASAMELFVIAWPADHLIEVSESVGNAAFNCDWIGKPPGMLKNIVFIIQRCRNPTIISVNGVLPVLSLEFYGSTMAATFSYLTTLRAMTAE